MKRSAKKRNFAFSHSLPIMSSPKSLPQSASPTLRYRLLPLAAAALVLLRAVCIYHRLDLFHQRIIILLIVDSAEHRLSPALVGPDQQENQTGEREDQARDADDSVAHAYSSNWAMNSSIALRVTRRQLLVPRRLGGRNVVRVPLFAAMSSA